MEIDGSVFRFGGFVLAHAAAIASGNGEGELICPFAVVVRQGRREVEDFEAQSQAEAVERGKASLDEYRDKVDLWGLAREGLYSVKGSEEPKTDVLLVSVWAPGMQDTIEFMQRFCPAFPGPFALLGEAEVFIEGNMQKQQGAAVLRSLVSEGIAQHPKGSKWMSWKRGSC